MKNITRLLVFSLLFALAPVTYAHTYHQQTVNEIPTFPQCAELDTKTCPEYKEYLLDLLIELIALIKEAREERENADEDSVQDNEMVVDEREVVNISRSEARKIRDRTYRVLSDGMLSGESRGDIPDVVLALWNDFKIISSDEVISEYMSSLRAFYDEDEVAAAYVETDASDYTKWVLGINIADYVNDRSPGKRNYFQVLVHEFAHILTLNEDQLDLRIRGNTCGTYNPGEGCAYANSYLHQFVDEFWEDDDFDASEEAEDERDPDEADKIIQQHYEDNDDEFVSPYAATNPVEDLAETFAFYVFEETVPTRARSKIDEKFLFLNGFSEIREIREDIRGNFADVF